MTAGTDKLKQAFRDYITDGVPFSGPNDPDKAEIRAALEALGIDIAAASLGDLSVAVGVLQPLVDEAEASATAVRAIAPSIKAKLGADLLDVSAVVVGSLVPDAATGGTPTFISNSRTQGPGIGQKIRFRRGGTNPGTAEVGILVQGASANDFTVLKNFGSIATVPGVNEFAIPDNCPLIPANAMAFMKPASAAHQLRSDATTLIGARSMPATVAMTEGTTVTTTATTTSTFAIDLTVLAAPVTFDGRIASAEAGLTRVNSTAAYLGPGAVTEEFTTGFDLDGTLVQADGRTSFAARYLEAGERLDSVTVAIGDVGDGTGSIVIERQTSPTTGLPLAVINVTGITGGLGDIVTIPLPTPYLATERVLVGFYGASFNLSYKLTVAPTGPAQRHGAGKPVVGVPKTIDTVAAQPGFRYTAYGVTNPVAPRVDKAEADIEALQAGAGITTPPGKYLPASPGNAMYSWRAKAARIKAGAAVQAKVLMIGSSSVDYPEVPQGLIDIASPILGGVSGHGYVGVGLTDTMTNGATVTVGTGWTRRALVSDQTKRLGLDGASFEASAAGSLLTWNGVRGTNFSLFLDDATGAYEYRVDSGAWVAIATGGTEAIKTVAFTAAAGLHKIELRTTSADLARYLAMYATSPAVAGVEVSKAGYGGSDTADWATFAPQITPYLTAINPDVIQIWLTGNDLRANRAPATTAANLAILFAVIKAALPNCAVVLVIQPAIDGTFSYTTADYRDALAALSKTDAMLEYFSLGDIFGSRTAMAALFKDSLHLNVAGGRMAMSEFWWRLGRAA